MQVDSIVNVTTNSADVYVTFIAPGCDSICLDKGIAYTIDKDLDYYADQTSSRNWKFNSNTTDLGSNNYLIKLDSLKSYNMYYVYAYYVTGNSNYKSYRSEEATLKTFDKGLFFSCYGGSNEDTGEFIIETPDSGYIIAGITNSNDGDISGYHGYNDICIVKVDGIGDVVWEKTLGGSGDEKLSGMYKGKDGGYVILGQTWSEDGDVSENHGEEDIWIVKIDEGGTIEWERSYGGSNFDGAISLIPEEDGGYIIFARTASDDGDFINNERRMIFYKINNFGEIIWKDNFDMNLTGHLNKVIRTRDNGYLIIGSYKTDDYDDNGILIDGAYISKIDLNGSFVWEQKIHGEYSEEAIDVVQLKNGSIVLTGRSLSFMPASNEKTNSSVLAVKLSEDGIIVWEKQYGDYFESGISLTQNSFGNVVLCCSLSSPLGNIDNILGGTDIGLLEISNDGNILRSVNFGGTGLDEPYSIIATDFGYGIIGKTYSYDFYSSINNHWDNLFANSDFLLLSIREDGTLIND
ncbi:hypothetical protein ACE1ET_00730 [Saccharicrinis sp. FJH62]|uniref:hypothetical protein n=1 Tax=Saccharicrinis sp. FJH62 TaxID=3344657 RepID=UPI0035D41356